MHVDTPASSSFCMLCNALTCSLYGVMPDTSAIQTGNGQDTLQAPVVQVYTIVHSLQSFVRLLLHEMRSKGVGQACMLTNTMTVVL